MPGGAGEEPSGRPEMTVLPFLSGRCWLSSPSEALKEHLPGARGGFGDVHSIMETMRPYGVAAESLTSNSSTTTC